MEYLIKDLLQKLSSRKLEEMALINKYKNEGLQELLLIASGKVMELERQICDLKEMLNYHSKTN